MGNGFSYNPGEPVEGFTSFLYVVLMAGFFKIFNLLDSSLSTVIKMSILGRIITLLFTFGSFLYLIQFLKKIFKYNNIIILISMFLLALRIDFIYHSTSGLETGMFIFVLIAFFYHLFCFSVTGIKKKSDYILMLIFGTAVILTRADGYIFIGTSVIIWNCINLFNNKKNLKKFFIDFVIISIPFLIALIGYHIFRYLYFHDLFPNTYYVKVPDPNKEIFSLALWHHSYDLIPAWQSSPITALKYVFPSIGILFILLILFSAVLILLNKFKEKFSFVTDFYNYYSNKKGSNFSLFQVLLFIIISLILFTSYVIYIGGDWMPGFRYLTHFFPVYYVLIISVITHFLILFLKHDNVKLFISYACSAVFICCMIISLISINNDFLFKSKFFYDIGNNTWISNNHSFYIFREKLELKNIFTLYADFTSEIKKRLNENDAVAVYEAGCIAVMIGNNHRIIDISGLNNKMIAKNDTGEGVYSMCNAFLYTNTGKIRGPKDRYVLQENPKLIIFDTFEFMGKDIPDLILGGNYRLIKNFPNNSLDFFTVFERVNN